MARIAARATFSTRAGFCFVQGTMDRYGFGMWPSRELVAKIPTFGRNHAPALVSPNAHHLVIAQESQVVLYELQRPEFGHPSGSALLPVQDFDVAPGGRSLALAYSRVDALNRMWEETLEVWDLQRGELTDHRKVVGHPHNLGTGDPTSGPVSSQQSPVTVRCPL